MKFNPTLREAYPGLVERAERDDLSVQCRLSNFAEYDSIKKEYKIMVAAKKAYWKGFEKTRKLALADGINPKAFRALTDVNTFYKTMDFLAREIAVYRSMLDEFKAYCAAGYKKVIKIDKRHVREGAYERQDFRYRKVNSIAR